MNFKFFLFVVFMVSFSFGRIITDTVKAGVGTFTNGCRAYNNTEHGTYIGLFKGVGALPGFPSNYFPVLKTDNDHFYLSVDGKYSGVFGGNDFQLGMNDSSETRKIQLHTRGLSYFRGGKVNFDSISFSSGSTLNTYLDTTFYDSLFENDVFTGQLTTSRIIQIGKTVTKYQRHLVTTTSGGHLTIKGLPSKFRPSSFVGNAINIVNYNTTILGMYSITSTGLMLIRKIDNTDLDASNLAGVSHSVITWVID